jgi:prolyl oligopeptidase
MKPFCSIRFISRSVGLATLSLTISTFFASGAEPGITQTRGAPATDDPFLWLEEVSGEKALDWVRTQNAQSKKELEASTEFERTRKRLLAILDSKEKIPYVSKHGAWYYNFWRDEKNVRGLWRRTTLAEFKKPQPAWETVLDLDQLAAAEKENWVWKSYTVLYPKY